MTVQAALFDLDGTLVDTEARSRAAWVRLFSAHDVPCDEAMLVASSGLRGQDFLARHVQLFGGRTVHELFEEAVGYSRAPDAPPATPVPGAVEYLHLLRREQVPIGVVTSSGQGYVDPLLAQLGVRDLLAVVITADDVAAGKPEPDGYLAGCAALGVPPDRVVAFEDSPIGLAAARAAGMPCVGLATTQPAAALSGADLVVADLTEVSWPLVLRA